MKVSNAHYTVSVALLDTAIFKYLNMSLLTEFIIKKEREVGIL